MKFILHKERLNLSRDRFRLHLENYRYFPEFLIDPVHQLNSSHFVLTNGDFEYF